MEALATQYDVTMQTIRRDIKALSRRNLLHGFRGGAGLPAGTERLAYTARRSRNADAKRRIGLLVAEQIPNETSVFVDIGTTTEAVAEALVGHKGLRVITNHISVANIFCEFTDFEITLTGGLVRNRDRAITGEACSEFLKQFRVGVGIFSIGAIHGDGQMLDYDYRDVLVSKTALSICRRKIVVADHSKFDGDAMVFFASVADVDAFVTDQTPPPDIAAALAEHRVELMVAK